VIDAGQRETSLLTFGLVVAMSLAGTAVLWVAGSLQGYRYPPKQAVLNALLCAVPSAAGISLTLAVSSYTLDKARTALIMIPAKLALPLLMLVPGLLKWPAPWMWNFSTLGNPISLQAGLLWRPLATLLVLAVGGAAIAANRYTRMDY
jgi:hypothetical protein